MTVRFRDDNTRTAGPAQNGTRNGGAPKGFRGMGPLAGTIVVIGAFVAAGVTGCSDRWTEPKGKAVFLPNTPGAKAEVPEEKKLNRPDSLDAKIAGAYAARGMADILKALDPKTENPEHVMKNAVIEFASAAKCGASADSLNAKLADGWAGLCTKYLEKNKGTFSPESMKHAQNAFDNAIKYNPSLADYLKGKFASVYVDLGRGHISTALDQKTSNPMLWLDKAGEMFKGAVGWKPGWAHDLGVDIANAYVRYGDWLLSKGDIEGAQAAFKKAREVSLSPADSSVSGEKGFGAAYPL